MNRRGGTLCRDVCIYRCYDVGTALAVNQAGPITQRTDYPWNGDIDFEIDSASIDLILKLRIPGWAVAITLEPSCAEAALENGG